MCNFCALSSKSKNCFQARFPNTSPSVIVQTKMPQTIGNGEMNRLQVWLDVIKWPTAALNWDVHKKVTVVFIIKLWKWGWSLTHSLPGRVCILLWHLQFVFWFKAVNDSVLCYWNLNRNSGPVCVLDTSDGWTSHAEAKECVSKCPDRVSLIRLI